MTKREIQIELERRILTNDPETIIKSKLNSNTLFSFINEAIDLFWKTRYSGLNQKLEGFELSLKRIDDLRSLIKSHTYTSKEIINSGNKYSVELPEDYTILLGDTAGIEPNDDNKCWDKDSDNKYIIKHTDTLEATIENIDRQLANSLSEHRLRYCQARPLKLLADNTISLYTDGKYKVSEYTINYLTKPKGIHTNDNLTEEYTEFPAHTHMEIIKLAVRLYAATKPTQNYNALAQETQVME